MASLSPKGAFHPFASGDVDEGGHRADQSSLTTPHDIHGDLDVERRAVPPPGFSFSDVTIGRLGSIDSLFLSARHRKLGDMSADHLVGLVIPPEAEERIVRIR